MSQCAPDVRSEVSSILRKSDQACSIHALLRDRYRWRANVLDYSMMASTTYLLGLSLVEPVLGISLSFGLDRTKLTTVLILVSFFFSVVQFKNDWKSKAQAHQRSFEGYAEVKAECRSLTVGIRVVTVQEYQRIRDLYDTVTKIGTEIPEDKFISGKAHHLRKIAVSKYLDSRPSAWVPLVRLRLFMQDNVNFFGKNGTPPKT